MFTSRTEPSRNDSIVGARKNDISLLVQGENGNGLIMTLQKREGKTVKIMTNEKFEKEKF